MTEEQKQRILEAHKGQVAWNKGKKKPYSKETIWKIKMGRERTWENSELRKRQSILTK